MNIAQRGKSSRGQITILFIIALPVLLGCASLVIDVFRMYMQKAALQSAVDGAALAGASYLPLCQTGTAIANLPTCSNTSLPAAQSVYNQNRGDPNAWTNEVGSNYQYSTPIGQASLLPASLQPGGIVPPTRMTITATVPNFSMLLGQVLGIGSFPISATSTAEEMPTLRAWAVIPIGVDYRTAQQWGNLTNISFGKPSDCTLPATCAPGYWSPVSMGGSGGSDYLNNLLNGYQNWLNAGDNLTSASDPLGANTLLGVTTRTTQGLVADPSGTFSSHTLSDPRVATVPMVDLNQVSSATGAPVVGFAEIWVVSFNETTRVLQAYFIPSAVPGGKANNSPSNVIANASSFGALAPVLIQ